MMISDFLAGVVGVVVEVVVLVNVAVVLVTVVLHFAPFLLWMFWIGMLFALDRALVCGPCFESFGISKDPWSDPVIALQMWCPDLVLATRGHTCLSEPPAMPRAR